MAGNLTAMIASIFSGGVTPDPYYEYTTLLLPGNGTNGAQNNTFLDGSTNNFTITRNGNTTQGTFSPFSQTGWGNYFDGTGDSIYASSANTANAMGTGDWTIEASVYKTNSTEGYVFDTLALTGGSTDAIRISISSSGAVYFYKYSTLLTSGGSIALNTWNHIAVVRQSQTIKIYLNGTQVNTTYSDTGSNYTCGTNRPLVGINGYDIASDPFQGYISNLRAVKGVAVYTGNFTPPTSPLAATQSAGTNISAITGTQTSLLTCQSNRFIDNSSNNFTITRNGDTRVVAFSPFNPTASWSAATNGGSGYFDGSGDYLNGPTNTATAFNLTGDFTIECWCYFNSVATSYAGIVNWSDSSGWNGFQLFNNAGTLGFEFLTGSAAAGQVSGGAVITGQWYFLQIVRSGSTITFYKNGTSIATATYSSSQTSSSSFIKVGVDRTAANYTTGYISGLRIVNGSALSNSVPTSPPTAITNTRLLLNFTNAGIYDATSKNDLETVGNAQISTTQSKWGGSSISFDGTGDWLLIPDQPPQRIGTGNFTVEMWVYRNSSGTYGLAGKGTGTTGWLVSLNSSNQVVFTYGSSTITSSGTVSATTWTHIAVVREGTSTNQTKIYIGGSNDGTGTVSTDFNQTNSMYIGADRTGGSAANAYVQDVRITNYARYTANFTPPTAAFPTL
jgi:hypothetical protein